MRRLALVCVFAFGCGSSMHHASTMPDEPDEEEATGDVPIAEQDVPAKVRISAVDALKGADKISFVHTSAGQYEASAVIDGEEQDITISPSGAVIDMEEVDDIDLNEEDDATTAVAPTGDQPDDEETID